MLKDSEKDIPKYIIDEMIDYLYMKGLLIKSKDSNESIHIPSIIYPSPIPKTLFDKIKFYQIAFNIVIDKLSRDQAFLEEILTPISEKDEFIKKNLELSKKAAAFEQKQNIQLSIYRNDYMVDSIKKFIYQVEYNTIACSLGYFSDGIKHFYNHFSTKYPEIFEKYINKPDKTVPVETEDCIEEICKSMIEAIKLFSPEDYKNTLIVFVISDKEKNIYDQRSIEFLLWEKYQIKCKRLTLNEIAKNCTQDEQKNIILDSKKVSLFYFRTCYSESDYTDEESWKGRELIELSTAIKCPNINTFLTTFKVFQYQITKPDVLKKYLKDDLIINDILRFFTKIHYLRDLDKEKQKEVLTEVLNNVNNFVVKPQKEGGGNNIYGDKIKELIPSADAEPSDQLLNSIIMEKINPPQYETAALIQNQLKIFTAVSEFSVYGIVISDATTLHINKPASFLVRTKDKDSTEGGVVVGISSIDCPCLVEMTLNKEDTNPITYNFS